MTTPHEAPSSPAGLRIGETPARGRGVFAARRFAAGEVIERAPVIVFSRAIVQPLAGTRLDDYWFWWDETHNCLGLGCASLYNHAAPANARFARDPRPLDENCDCLACRRFSRGYIRHLVNQQEILGPRLLTLLKAWSHAMTVYRTGPDARHAMNPLVIADDRHHLHRYHADHPRATLMFDAPSATQPLAARFDEIWATGEPGLSATTLGL